jgi:hypothetical protein
MNKEAKIGLSVIFVLLIIFVAVVAKRLYTSHAAEQAFSSEGKEADESEAAADPEKEASNKMDKTGIAIALSGQPRVIAATTATDKPPQGVKSDDGSWNLTSDSDKEKVSGGGTAESKPRDSYMPRWPKGDVDDRYDRLKKTNDREVFDSRQPSGIFGASGRSDAMDSGDNLRQDRGGGQAGGGRIYIAAEGDSLFDIARCKLGKASRWVEIYNLNTDVLGKNIDCLAPGTRIALPNDAGQTGDLSGRAREM